MEVLAVALSVVASVIGSPLAYLPVFMYYMALVVPFDDAVQLIFIGFAGAIVSAYVKQIVDNARRMI